MIVEPRLVEYLNSLEMELPPYLAELEAYALQTEVPIIRKEAQSLLRFFIELKQPKQILAYLMVFNPKIISQLLRIIEKLT